MPRRRGRPTTLEAEAAGQMRLTLDTALDAAATAHALTRAVRRAKNRSTDDQLRLRLFTETNRDMHAVNRALHDLTERLETYRQAIALAA